jgi:hypothetical protein
MRKSDLIPGWIEKELRAHFARASRAGRRELTNGATITLPVKLLSGLKGARPKDLRAVEVLGRGSGLHWEGLDVDLSVAGLLSSLFSGPEWLAVLGRIGGRNSSAAKAAAARKNGRKGGRPRTRSRKDSVES